MQIGIGVLDLGAGALAMYALLPADPPVDFITLLVIFVTATLLGFLSHAPGSLGVFEAAMLIALPQFQNEALLASLLIFRVLYFVLPFCLAVLLLSAREAGGPQGPRQMANRGGRARRSRDKRSRTALRSHIQLDCRRSH